MDFTRLLSLLEELLVGLDESSWVTCQGTFAGMTATLRQSGVLEADAQQKVLEAVLPTIEGMRYRAVLLPPPGSP